LASLAPETLKPQIVADPLCHPVTTCIPGVESTNFNYLVLILCCLARALRQEKLRQPARTALAVPAQQPKRELLLLICCRCSRVKYSFQFMIVVNCKRGGLRVGNGVGAEQGVGKTSRSPNRACAPGAAMGYRQPMSGVSSKMQMGFNLPMLLKLFGLPG
jgi:hypothetical protein